MNDFLDLSSANAIEVAKFLLKYIPIAIPNSSTKRSLAPEGYPADGAIEQTIRGYQHQTASPYEAAVKALESGCGNCQEMAYLGALILRAAGYKGEVAIGQYGINHQFLLVEDLIVDPWAEFCCLKSMWRQNITAYGGSVRQNIMHGRLLSPEHYEMEDEEPEVIEVIPSSYKPALSIDRIRDLLLRKEFEPLDTPTLSESPYPIKQGLK